MYSDTITLFNHYESDSGNMWFPHVLKGVTLIADKASIIAKYGENSSDNAKLHIRYAVREDRIIIQDKEYLPSKKWRKCPVDELGNLITFDTKHDFIIAGEYEGIGPVMDDDYESGFYDHMAENEDFCYTLTSVGQYKLIPHFEIMCK